MTQLANAIDAIPVAETTARRSAMFPSPQNNQRVQNLETRAIERYDSALGTWLSSSFSGGAVNIQDYGAVGDGAQSNKTINSAAIRAALAAAAASSTRKTVYVPAGTYVTDDNFTLTSSHNGVTICGEGPSSCIKLANSPNVGNVEAGWMFMLKDTTTLMSNIRLTGLRLDGSQSTISWGDTSHGVVGYQDSKIENVQVDNCIAHDFLTNGFFSYVGGMRFVACQAYNCDSHGFAVSFATTFGDADKVVEISDCTSHDNFGYGMDAGHSCRTVISNANCYWNDEGGLKYSTGTDLLVIRGAHVAYNRGNGIQDTDTTIGNAKLDWDGIVTHHNGGLGVRVVTGKSVRIGSVTSYDNYCRTNPTRDTSSNPAWVTSTAYVATDVRSRDGVNYYCTANHTSSALTEPGLGFLWETVWREQWYTGGSLLGADIAIGSTDVPLLRYLDADSLRSARSPSAGIHIDGNILSYRLGYVEAVESQTYGFGDYVSGTYTAWVTSTAYVLGNSRSNGGNNYVCLIAHTSGASTEPGVGASWRTVWELLGLPAGVVESGLMVNNNNAATAASAAAAAFAVERAGAIKVSNVIFRDHQETVTQHSGMYFSSAIQADVELCHFGVGISAGSEVYSATAGTVVRFGHNNTGTLVTRARGTAAESGGGGTATVTYPTAISNLGGLVYFASVYPTTSDASEANYISAVSRTALTLTCPGTFGAGSIGFRYDVQAEVQR